MSDIRHASKEFIAKFIQIYRSHPALWKVKSKEYVNRSLKDAGYDALVDFYKQVDPKANRDLVSKKIQSMRGSFRKELKKYKLFKKNGGESEKYVPSLWYFHLLIFTLDGGTSEDIIDGLDVTSSYYQTDAFSEEEEKDESASIQVPLKRVKKEIIECEPERRTCVRSRSNALEGTDIMTTSAAFGKFVAAKHSELDYIQQVYAENLITNILNKAKLKELTEYTTLCEVQSPAMYHQNACENSSPIVP